MFKSARIKLTAWYLIIIMAISLAFSFAMYRVLTSELDRVERVQRLRAEGHLPDRSNLLPLSGQSLGTPMLLRLDPDLIEETKGRLILFLAFINLTILGGSGLAGYFLAGRTLKPIKEMVAGQSRFVTDSSHELRTPLTSLKSEIEVNLRDKALTLEGARALLQSNLEEVNKLQTLSDRLIKMTQYLEDQARLPFGEVSLVAVVAEAIGQVEKLARNKKITIVNNTPDCALSGSKPTLVELLVILMDNAIKYSPKDSKITVSAEKADDRILVRVTDEGRGISSADLPHIFDRFYRADKSRVKNETDGYGLGLSIAKQIVTRHGGSIRVETKLNKGTTFTVELPLRNLAEA